MQTVDVPATPYTKEELRNKISVLYQRAQLLERLGAEIDGLLEKKNKVDRILDSGNKPIGYFDGYEALMNKQARAMCEYAISLTAQIDLLIKDLI